MMIRAFYLAAAVNETCDRCPAKAVYAITFGESMESLLVFCHHDAREVAAQHSDVPNAVLNSADHDVPVMEPVEALLS